MDMRKKLLEHKWPELLILTTSAYQAIHGAKRMGTTRTDGEKAELHQEVSGNECITTVRTDALYSHTESATVRRDNWENFSSFTNRSSQNCPISRYINVWPLKVKPEVNSLHS